MPEYPNVAFYSKLLNERFEHFKAIHGILLDAFGRNKPDDKVSACQSAHTALNRLMEILPSHYRPGWMQRLDAHFTSYMAHSTEPAEGRALLDAVLENYAAMRSENFQTVAEKKDFSVDFESLYKEAYNTTRVSALFDRLIGEIETLIQSGAVEKVKAVKALEKLLASLRQNRNGSLLAIMLSRQWAGRLFSNVVRENLSSIPLAGPTFAAIYTTIDEIDAELQKLNESMNARLATNVGEELLLVAPAPEPLVRPAQLMPPTVIDIAVDSQTSEGAGKEVRM
jgi:uncharacterized protein YaaR (DUF327 family)